MIRFILLSILLTILLRAFNVIWRGIVRGIRDGDPGRPGGASRAPQQGVHMVRDPVCGTFIIPDRALTLPAAGGERIYFCSAECRDKYRAGPRSAAHSRTA